MRQDFVTNLALDDFSEKI